jgi:Carboxypeptidase regulatory-like domain
MTACQRHASFRCHLAKLLLVGLLCPTVARAQSVIQGALQGEVLVSSGLGVPDAAISLEDEGGSVVRRLRTDTHGRFSLSLVTPGIYSVLVEKVGFQPFRQRGVIIQADQQTELRITVARRPPPIASVEESVVPDQRFSPGAPRASEVLGGREFVRDGNRLDLAEAGRFATGVVAPGSARWGLGDVVGSLPQSQSRLSIDGLPAFWLRHPGVETQPAGNPLVPPFLLQEARLVASGPDAETPGSPAGMVSVVSRGSTRGFRIEPFLSWGGSPGLTKELDPADSGLKSLQVGALVTGTLVKDKAQFLVGAGYESLDLPSARPWTRDSALLGTDTVGLVAGIEQIARDTFNFDARPGTRPPLRTYHGGVGSFAVDWQLSPVHRVTARAAGARHTEESPELGLDLLSGGEGKVESKDFLGSVTVASTWGLASNEFRMGFQSATCDWTERGPATTYFTAEEAGLGASPALPGYFKRSTVEFVESFLYQFGSAGQNRFKFGLSYSSGKWNQDYVYGRNGIFQFGDLELYSQGRGAFFDVSAENTSVSFKLREISLFSHVQWQLSPSLTGLVALRWDRQNFPSSSLVFDTAFASTFGIRNQTRPNDNFNLSPRLGLLWRGGADRRWLVSLVGALDNGQLNPARFAEAVLNNRDLRVRRATNTLFDTWPEVPDTNVLVPGARRFAIFSPSGGYRDPRTTKLDLDLTRRLAAGLTLRGTARYHHTDFLLRRTDLNLLPTPTGFTQEGRPVYGTLEKSGGLIIGAPGSNRRITDYDLVSGFASTGAQDFYEAVFGIAREVPRGLSFSANYSFSRARDNWPQSWSGDPTEELSPFPSDPVDGGWAKGISDFDVPQRVNITAFWQSSGRLPIKVGGRYRFQSGRPYTPGFQPGVDANGDGSGRNDPAFVDANIDGMPSVVLKNDCLGDQLSKFAKRNSCREDGRHALDLGASVTLPIRSIGSPVEITFDLINLFASRSGIVDHALVLVDPQGTLVTDGAGNVTLPLVANPRFGKLVSRRDEPRVLRLGLRLGNW